MAALIMLRLLFLALMTITAAGCAADTSDDEDYGGDDERDPGEEPMEESSSALSGGCGMSRSAIMSSTSNAKRLTAIQRGFTWLDANVPYSQSRSYKGYRTDCSGFVSMAWNLGTSYNTASFMGGGAPVRQVAWDQMMPADAFGKRGHIMLFLGWNDAGHKNACVLEQASTASDMQFRVRSAASLKSQGYKGLRPTR